MFLAKIPQPFELIGRILNGTESLKMLFGFFDLFMLVFQTGLRQKFQNIA